MVWLKRSIILVICIGLLCVVGIIGFELAKSKNVGNEKVELHLEKLKSAENYQFENLEWGMSPKEVEVLLPYGLEASNKNMDIRKINEFRTRNKYELAQQSGRAYFCFESDGLQLVRFVFVINDNYQEWFMDCVEELTELYGMEAEITNLTESGYEELSGMGYRWDAHDTTLQINVLQSSDGSATVNIADGAI